jgi:predicted nucleic acid-binding protein
MPRREQKYALDTQLFVSAFRDPTAYAELQGFHLAFAPFEFLAAVVVQELRIGAFGVHADRLEEHLFRPFERRGRLITPSYSAWKRAGEALARLSQEEGLELRAISRGFANDVLLAATCREAGVVLVTGNRRDFERISRVLPFDFVDPWPVRGRP